MATEKALHREQKAQIVLEILKEECSIAQIASEYRVLISDWFVIHSAVRQKYLTDFLYERPIQLENHNDFIFVEKDSQPAPPRSFFRW